MSTIQSCSRSLHFFSNKRIQVIVFKGLEDLRVKIILNIKGQNWSYDIPVNKCTQKYPIGFPLYFQNSEIKEKEMWFWQTIIKKNFPTTPFPFLPPFLPTPLQPHKIKRQHNPNKILQQFQLESIGWIAAAYNNKNVNIKQIFSNVFRLVILK